MQNGKFTIEEARRHAGFLQAEMAKMLGMSEKAYLQYEKYRVIFRMDKAKRFSELTGIDMDFIIFFEKKLEKICSS